MRKKPKIAFLFKLGVGWGDKILKMQDSKVDAHFFPNSVPEY